MYFMKAYNTVKLYVYTIYLFAILMACKVFVPHAYKYI